MSSLDSLLHSLPIGAVVPAFEAELQRRRNFVVQAEPGAGKTTVLPLVLLQAGVADAGLILVSQPRRLAARMAATRVAHLLGERVGGTCGYAVRFEAKHGPQTKILFVTEGLLLRRLIDEPTLPGVAAVVLDEFHERHIEGDTALALLLRLQREARPELRIGVMSATLDADAVARHLECEPLRSEGRCFPVSLEYQPSQKDRDLASAVAQGLRTALGEGTTRDAGNVLVFLPGAGEIRQATQRCEGFVRAHGYELHALHGEMPPNEQDSAVSDGGRKVILATNVAETSVTIPGITTVIDSGLVRRPVVRAWSGITELSTAKISQASAIQRAGRAGRTAPGTCIRLYAEHDFQRRPAFDPPEITRADLTSLALEIRAAGADRIDAVPWLDPPPAGAVASAEELLRRLSALDDAGALTSIGREMLRFPVHPRLARLLVEARRRGVSELGATVAALLSERSIRRFSMAQRRTATRAVHVADVLLEAQRFESGRSRRWRDDDLDANACQRVEKAREQLLGLLQGRCKPPADREEAIIAALVTAYPDRVARVRTLEGGERDLALVGSGHAELDRGSAVADATFIVAVQAQDQTRGTSRRTVVTSAAALEPEWLLELFPDRVQETVIARFNAQQERVEAVRELRYEDLVLESTRLQGSPPEAVEILRQAAIAKGLEAFAKQEDIDQLIARSRFAAEHGGRITALSLADFEHMLGRLCEGKQSFAQLRREDVVAWVLSELPEQARSDLERFAPTHATLPNKRRVQVHYEADRAPWIASRLQDFFGTSQSPTIANGRVPLVLHLLAPNQRPVQVTTDLPSFWSQHYPELRRQLMRRYPKHAWPEDPSRAEPPPLHRPRERR